jgi:hypothetical protein
MIVHHNLTLALKFPLGTITNLMAGKTELCMENLSFIYINLEIWQLKYGC